MRIILETNRLNLREMEDSDSSALQRVISNPEIMKYYDNPYNDNLKYI